MAGPITGTKGAYQQPSMWGRNEQGNYTVQEFHGTKQEIANLASLFSNIEGLVYEVKEGYGRHSLNIRIPFSVNGIDPRTDKIDNWELFAQHVEKDLLESAVENPGTVGTLTSQQIQKIRSYLFEPPDGKTISFPQAADLKLDGPDDGSIALSIYQLMQQGVRNFPVEAPSLRHTIITSNQYAVPASLLNVRKVISSSSLSYLELLPSALLFSIPFETSPNPALTYGWYKTFPTVQQLALLKWSITLEYQYGLWSTLLWGQAL
ncbi:MAG TPA: hypothetical protein VG167_18960 [Verrucomicrobiae bacterium]|nr:hypothetical protein [Verrucomicrobiae bacterium]